MAVNSEVVRLPKRSIALVLGAFLACVAGSAVGTDEAWQAAKVPLMTRWGKALTPASVLPEYPRPQMVRAAWQNLNGLWDYAVTAKAAEAPKGWQGKILVPFAIESALSGVHKGFDRNQRLWYHRTFDVPKEWAGQRVLLHFGAVDWEAAVTVNGKAVGTHRGGYDAFAFDITDALTAAGTQELVVNVLDATGDGQAKGKQTAGALAGFGTLGYCSASGIWLGARLSPFFAGTQTRPSLRSDSLIRVSFDWYSPDTGMHVGWICVKQGFANSAPCLCARQMAVALEPLALVER